MTKVSEWVHGLENLCYLLEYPDNRPGVALGIASRLLAKARADREAMMEEGAGLKVYNVAGDLIGTLRPTPQPNPRADFVTRIIIDVVGEVNSEVDIWRSAKTIAGSAEFKFTLGVLTHADAEATFYRAVCPDEFKEAKGK
jgi:hypothetical protein